jgi:hypothetical protein
MRAIFVLLICLTAGCGSPTAPALDLAMPDMTVVVNGCPSWVDPIASPGDPIDGDTWQTYAQGWFASWCTRCHSTTAVDRQGAPSGYDWDVEYAVRAHLSMIRNAVGVMNFMPLTAPLPSCDDRRRLARWIDAGAP